MTALPVVPPVTNNDRYQTFTIASSTSYLDLDYPLYGDATDIVVYKNSAVFADWTFSSIAGGSDLSILPRPITDGRITFTNAQTSGTFEIVYARNPRFTPVESAGIARREYNQNQGDIWSTLRELKRSVDLTETARDEAVAAAAAAEALAASYVRTKHADQYASIDLAIADLGDNERLLLGGGSTYTPVATSFTSWPNNFSIESDNGLPAIIDFSGNASFVTGGLINITGSTDNTTTEAITQTLEAGEIYRVASATYAAGTITITTVDDHPFSSGDYAFISIIAGAATGDVEYLTMKDSDEGMVLSLPVEVTSTGAKTFTYAPPNGGTPSASCSLATSLFVYKNDLYVKVADITGYANGDMVQIVSDDTFGGYNGSVVLNNLENNEIDRIEGVGFWLKQPVRFVYATNPTVEKVNPKTFKMKGIHIKGKGANTGNTGGGQSDIGIYWKYARDVVLQDMKVTDCDYAAVRHAQDLRSRVIDIEIRFDRENSGGAASGFIEYQYGGWVSSGSRDPLWIRPRVFGGRHALNEAAVSNDGDGRVINFKVLFPHFENQWSANFATHDMYDFVTIIGATLRGGDGINIRNGHCIVYDVDADGAGYGVYAYGQIRNMYIGRIRARNCRYAAVRLTPSNKAVAHAAYEGPLPWPTNITVDDVFGSRATQVIWAGASTGSTPETLHWEDFSFTNIRGENLRDHVILLASSTGTYSYRNGRIANVFGRNCGDLIDANNPIRCTFDDICGYDLDSGAVGVSVAGSSAADNWFYKIRGTISGGGAMTPLSLVATSTGNKTDSVGYETLTIASGVVTKQFRNVPLTRIIPEGGSGNDDLDTCNGLQQGDQVMFIADDPSDIITLTTAGNLGLQSSRLLDETKKVCPFVHNGTNLSVLGPKWVLRGSKTWDPPSIADGSAASTTVTVAGATLGDFVRVSMFLDIQGMILTGYVSSGSTVTVRLQNETGGAIDLGSTTVYVEVEECY